MTMQKQVLHFLILNGCSMVAKMILRKEMNKGVFSAFYMRGICFLKFS